MKNVFFLAAVFVCGGLSADQSTGAYYNNNSNQLFYEDNSKAPYYPNTNRPDPAYNPSPYHYYQGGSYNQNNYQNNGYYPQQSYQNNGYYPQQAYQNGSYNNDGYGSYDPNTRTYQTGVYGGQPQGYSTTPGYHNGYYYNSGSVFNAEGGLNTAPYYNTDAARYRAGLGR